MSKPAKKPRGLAALSPERRREIQRMGGKTAAARGTLYQFTAADRVKGGKKAGKLLAGRPGYFARLGTLGTKKQGDK